MGNNPGLPFTCSALIRYDENVSQYMRSLIPVTLDKTYLYNPTECSTEWVDPLTNTVSRREPVICILDQTPVVNPTGVYGAVDMRRIFGTIYMYIEA
jgi:hypothetical protein